MGVRDLSITNSVVRMRVASARIYGRGRSATLHGGTLVPNAYQTVLEGTHDRVRGMLSQTVGPKGQGFFPLVWVLFRFVLACNVLGLVPYSFTVTSHLVVTFTLALMVWIGKLIYGFRLHGTKLFGRFLPAGTPLGMIPLLVPLEVLGFTITVVSLSVRLFANMMAGHILLKVIAGFAWSMMAAGGRRFVAHFIPMAVLFILRALETGVALVQAYVFTLLVCIYLTDVVHGGH